ncbi:MAG: protein-glutamate O-methyltransferase CheR, partial [Acidovorax defluvii]
LGSKESLRFSTHTEAFDDFVSENRIYRKKAGL